MRIVSLGLLFPLTAFVGLFTFCGCGDSSNVTEAKLSPEAKKADEALQGGMKEFMQSKGKTKPSGGR
jgi:hypothetical protein